MTTKKILGRGRPRKFDLDEAIAIAAELFHRRGYDGVGVAELSKKIGITAPSLYAAFGSKRELFGRVLQYYSEVDGAWQSAALAAGDTLEAAIYKLFIQAAEVYSANAERLGCLVIEGTRNCGDAKAQELTVGFRLATWKMVCDRIESDAPTLTHAQIEALADYAVMILAGLSGSARDGMSTEALRATAEIAAVGFSQQLV